MNPNQTHTGSYTDITDLPPDFFEVLEGARDTARKVYEDAEEGGFESAGEDAPEWLRELGKKSKENLAQEILYGGIGDWADKTYWGQDTGYLGSLAAAADLPGLGTAAKVAGTGMAGLGTLAGLMARETTGYTGPAALKSQAGIIGGPHAFGRRAKFIAAKRRKMELEKEYKLAHKDPFSEKNKEEIADKVATETGYYFNAPDAIGRFEIDDSAAKWIQPDPLGNGGPITRAPIRAYDTGEVLVGHYNYAPEVLPHPELYEFYPRLKKTKVVLDDSYDGLAQYDDIDNVITINPEVADMEAQAVGKGYRQYMKEVMLHEMNHAVQRLEKMSRGGSPAEFAEIKTARLVEADERMGILNSPIGAKLANAQRKGTYDRTVQRLMETHPEEVLQIQMVQHQLQADTISDARKIVKGHIEAATEINPRESYFNLLGEMDANLSGARADYDAAMRALKKWWHKNVQRETIGTDYSQAEVRKHVGKESEIFDKMEPKNVPFELDPTKHNIPNIQDLFKNPEYFKKAKGVEGKVVWMSPDEYMKEAEKVFKAQGESGSVYSGVERELVEKYAKDMQKGDKFPMLDLDWTDPRYPGQEGRNRAMAAKLLGIDKIPVVVRTKVTSDIGKAREKKNLSKFQRTLQEKIRKRAEETARKIDKTEFKFEKDDNVILSSGRRAKVLGKTLRGEDPGYYVRYKDNDGDEVETVIKEIGIKSRAW